MTSTAGTGTLQTRGGNSRLIEDASEFKRLLGSKAKDLFVTNASEVSLEYIPHSGSPSTFSYRYRYACTQYLLTTRISIDGSRVKIRGGSLERDQCSYAKRKNSGMIS
jgi:hypothetical protein